VSGFAGPGIFDERDKMLDKKQFTKMLGESQIIATVENDVLLVIALIEIRESVDRCIEQRIKSDKVLENVLKDIYSAFQELKPQN